MSAVILCTQGTYPFYGGGVTVWCETLINGLAPLDFTVYGITGHSSARSSSPLPRNVRQVLHVPLWGYSDPAEAFQPKGILRRRRATTPTAIKGQFLPLFHGLLGGILGEPTPEITARCGQALYKLWLYFQEYDWNRTWQHGTVWELFLDRMNTAFGKTLTLAEITDALHILRHYLTPLIVPLPAPAIIHNTCASHSGLVGILARHVYNAPIILTEHGVMIREQYMFIGQDAKLRFNIKRFLVKFNALLCRLNYHYADVICPVSNFNKRWEQEYGAPAAKIRTIHNGIDTERFIPQPKPPQTADRPTVVAATRVMPLKDIETMIRSAYRVRQVIPQVQYLVYGSLEVDPPYAEVCRRLIAECGLEDHFKLCGHHDRPQELYSYGDMCILSSISEGFPLTVLEAMACERPVVATDAGGVREVLADCGIIVPLHDDAGLAQGIITLLQDEPLRRTLGQKSRQRVIENYRIQVLLGSYETLYETAFAALKKRGNPA